MQTPIDLQQLIDSISDKSGNPIFEKLKVSSDGSTVVFGCVNLHSNVSSVYIFALAENTWAQQAEFETCTYATHRSIPISGSGGRLVNTT